MGLKQADFAVVVLVEQGGDGVGAFFGNLCGGNLQGGDGSFVGGVAQNQHVARGNGQHGVGGQHGGARQDYGISAGPIKMLAASGIKDFGKLLGRVADAAPLRRNVTIDDVGNVAAFLLSDLAAGVTAEITYVDAGFSQTAGLSADMV